MQTEPLGNDPALFDENEDMKTFHLHTRILCYRVDAWDIVGCEQARWENNTRSQNQSAHRIYRIAPTHVLRKK